MALTPSNSLSATSFPSTTTERRCVDVGLRERPAGLEPVVLHVLIGRRHAEDEDVAHLAVAPYDVRPRRGEAGGEPDRLRVRDRATNRVGVGGADARTALHALHRLVVEQPDLDGRAPHLERVRADHRAGDVLLHVRVHPLDDRHDGDEERDGDDDAEQREERAQLVGADLAKCDAQQIGQAHRDGRPSHR